MNTTSPGPFVSHVRERAGYTLVELMVALVIMTILSGLVFAVHHVTQRFVEPWQREMALENTLHVAMRRLHNDLIDAEALVAGSEETWRLTYLSRPEVRYTYRDSILLRNGRRLHDASISAVAFRLTPSSPATRYAPVGTPSADGVSTVLLRVEIHLALQSRERVRRLTTSTVLRLPRPWEPLPPLLPDCIGPDENHDPSCR